MPCCCTPCSSFPAPRRCRALRWRPPRATRARGAARTVRAARVAGEAAGSTDRRRRAQVAGGGAVAAHDARTAGLAHATAVDAPLCAAAFWYTHMTDGPSEQVPEPAPATGQQGWLTFPHSHAPCVQVPKLPADVWQAWPAPTHWPARQQPPALHADLLQQGWPGAPQLSQVNEPLEQRAFGAVQAPSEQQGWPGAPQLSQVNEPPEQRAFGAVQTAAPDAPTGRRATPRRRSSRTRRPGRCPPLWRRSRPARCSALPRSSRPARTRSRTAGIARSPAGAAVYGDGPPAPVAPPPPPSMVIVPADPPPPSDPAGRLLQSDDATTTATARPTTNDDDKGTRPQVIASLSLRLSRLARHSTRVARDRLRVRPRGLSSRGGRSFRTSPAFPEAKALSSSPANHFAPPLTTARSITGRARICHASWVDR